jgi:hypothetical protein
MKKRIVLFSKELGAYSGLDADGKLIAVATPEEAMVFDERDKMQFKIAYRNQVTGVEWEPVEVA